MAFGKKASIEDSIFIVILLFFAAILFIFAFMINSAISSSAIPAFESISPGISAPFTTVNNIFNNTIDYVYLALFFGLVIPLIITSFLTPTHPVFYVLAIIIFIVLVFVSVVLSNAYEAIASLPVFNSAVSHMPILNYLMSNLPLISIIIGVIAAIIIFSRAGEAGGQGGFAQTQ